MTKCNTFCLQSLGYLLQDQLDLFMSKLAVMIKCNVRPCHRHIIDHLTACSIVGLQFFINYSHSSLQHYFTI